MPQAQLNKVCPACGKQFDQKALVCSADGTVLLTSRQNGFSTIISPETLIGQNIDGYELIGLRNTGGKSYIFEAKQTASNTLVAFKMLLPELSNNKNSCQRFQQEGQMASSLNHTNAANVLSSGIMPTGQPYLVMELLNGITLGKLLAKESPVDLKTFERIFEPLCQVLQHAHCLGFVHRDLKLHHILIADSTENGSIVKLIDFGCSKNLEREQKLTVAGVVLGNAEYMSPEQCTATEVDPRSDIYSLGCIMYQALTGKKPFEGSIVELMQMHLYNKPEAFQTINPNVSVPENLEKAVLKALEKDPDKRQQSMDELWQDLVPSLKMANSNSVGSEKETFLKSIAKHFRN